MTTDATPAKIATAMVPALKAAGITDLNDQSATITATLTAAYRISTSLAAGYARGAVLNARISEV